jgi:protein-S-isoprenylcysteine O-methyltransferase Ste14
MQAYGLWSLVIINSPVFIIFAFSFAKPQSKRDWRSFGAFSAFLLQWPTLVTLAMYPILVVMYALLAKREEREMLARFGEAYRHYAARVPAYVPRLGRSSQAGEGLPP